MGLRVNQIRRISERHLPEIATILEELDLSDDMGGEEIDVDFQIFDKNVPCRISSLFGSERLIGFGIDPIKDVLIIFKDDYVITEDKRISINGIIYEIIYVVPKRSYSAMTRVVGREIS